MRWRERARRTLASDRLAQLTNGLPSPMRPTTVPSTRPALLTDKQSASASFALAKAQSATLRFQQTANESSTLSGDNAELIRLRAQVDYWKGEAEYEQQRQKAFQAALWSSDIFTQTQKQKAMMWFRQSPIECSSDVTMLPPRSSVYQEELSPMPSPRGASSMVVAKRA